MENKDLVKVNAELKAARSGVSVIARGNHLYLRATLPAKPGASKSAHQQDISLGIYANPAGIRRAKAEALKLSGELATKSFSWANWNYRGKKQEGMAIADWLEKFEADYFSKRARTPKTQTSFGDYLDA